MAGNSFGKSFRITTFGESHGEAIGAVIDGCPAGIDISVDLIQSELDKRTPGTSEITSQRKETDKVRILSGVFEGKTLGTPICLMIWNHDSQSSDYEGLKDLYRPSHADYTYEAKYGTRDYRGGGRASARETAARVAAGAIAKVILDRFNIKVYAFTHQVGNIILEEDYSKLDLDKVYQHATRCPYPEKDAEIFSFIKQIGEGGDSIGGIIRCIVKNCLPGLGEPVFDKLQADLAKAMLSINACKGFEIGSGFRSATMKGSEHNDLFYFTQENRFRTKTNNSGGIQGGISNGEDIDFRVAFKPTPSIRKTEKMLNTKGEEITLKNNKGRYDPCVVIRAVPVVEAMTRIVLADHLLRNKLSKIENI